jgi:pyruvate dehydrogenase E2 component (dihydrolipoamide acetyltransferase)
VTEGTITRWLKKVGERVEKDEPLFEVSTDKVDSEVPSPASGYLAEILVEEGQTVEVGTKLAVISETPLGERVPPEPGEPKASQESGGASATVLERGTESGTGTGGDAALVGGIGPEPAGEEEPLPVMSPLVRRMVAEHGLDPRRVPATGAGGRLTREDVLRYIEAAGGGRTGPAASRQDVPASPREVGQAKGGEGEAVRQRPAPVDGGPKGGLQASAGSRDEVVPFSNIRRRTAEHMVRSKAVAPHSLVSIEADYEAVEKVRRRVGKEVEQVHGVKLTYLPFVARAVVRALRDYPHLNASVAEDALIVHRYVNLGIAVDLEGQGLIVPVVHGAESLSVLGLAKAIADLAARARTRQLSAEDIMGGTFTISNPGPWGSFMTYPIIHQPQVAILSTDGVRRTPVVVEDEDGNEAIAVRSRGILGLAFDHRAVDGAYVARFLKELTELLRETDWELEL